MSEISKGALTSENNNSFPNNNTGYITPTILRTFNQNMIDSLVDEISYAAESASFNSRINELDPSGSQQSFDALQQATASLNAYTASQNSFNSSATSSIVALQNFSSSLDATFATDAELNSLSSSVATTTLGLSSSVAQLQDFSSSLDSTFATDAQLNAATAALESQIDTKLSTSSYQTDSASFDGRIDSLESWSSSLDSGFVSEAEFGAYTSSNDSKVDSLINATSSYAISSSVSTALDGKTDKTQFNSYTSSNDSKVNELISKTGSYATTGSNIFNGNQSLTGSVSLTGTITATSASFQYVETVFETASVIYSSGSNQFGDASDDTQTLYGSVRVVNELTASGLNYPTADNGEKSFLQTDGAGNLSLQYVDTIWEAFHAGESVSKGTPLYFSGSQGANPIAYAADAADPNKMPVIVIAGENITAGNTYEGIVLGLIEGLDLTGFTAGQTVYVAEGGGYSTSLPSGSNSITQVLGIVTKGGSGGKGLVLNPGPAQLPGLQSGYLWVGNGTNQPVEVATSSLNVLSSSFATTASFALNVTPTDVSMFLSKSVFDTYTGSAALDVSSSINSATQSLSSSIAVTTNALDLEVNGKLDSSSFNSYTASESTAVSASINSATQSLSSSIAVTTNALDLEVNGKLNSSSFEAYTASNDSKVDALINATGSYVTEAETGSFITSAQTASMSVLSSSFAVTASFALNATSVDTSSLVTTASFNSYTQSNDSVVNSLVAATSSYVTEAESGSFVTDVTQGINADLLIVTKGDGTQSNITIDNVTSASYSDLALTASFALNATSIDTGSFATTGSNTFDGNQYINNTIFVDNINNNNSPNITITQDPNATLYLGNTSGTSSLRGHLELNNSKVVLNTGDVIGAVNDVRIEANSITITSSMNLTGGVTASGFFGTASFATTASYALNATPTDVSMFLSESTFNTYTSSNDGKVDSLINATSSYVTDAAFNSFTSSQEITNANVNDDINILYDTKLNTSSFNSYTQSNDDKVDSLINATASYAISASVSTALDDKLDITSFNSYTQSNDSKVDALISATSSYALSASVSTALDDKLDITSFNSYTSSNDDKVDSLINATASYAISSSVAAITADSLVTASFSSQTLTFTKGDGSQFSLSIPDVSGSTIDTGSFATTGSNTFIGNQTVTGSVRVDGDLFLDDDGGTTQFLMNAKYFSEFKGIATRWQESNKTASVDMGEENIALLYYAYGTGYDNGYHIDIDSSGTTFGDYNTSYVKKPWLKILPNNNNDPAPQFQRGLGITGSLILSGSSTITDGEMAFYNNIPDANAIRVYSGSVEITSPQGTGRFYSNLPMTSSGLRINGTALVGDLIVSGGFAGDSSLQVLGNASVTGSTTFGTDFNTDTHIISGAVGIEGSLTVNGLNVVSEINTLIAATSSYITDSQTGSFVTESETGSFATISSNTFSGNQIITGSVYVGGGATNLIEVRSTTTPQTATLRNNSLTMASASVNSTITPIGLGSIDSTGAPSDIKQIAMYANPSKLGPAYLTRTEPAILAMNSSTQITPVIGFQSKASWTDGRVEILTPLSASAGLTASLAEGYVWVGGAGNVTVLAATSSFGGGAVFPYTGSAEITGSLIVTGSVNGFVNSLSIASQTASMNLNDGNFFTLQLVSGSDTHIVPSGIKPGQSISLLLSTTGSGTVSFPSSVKQQSGSAYVPTTSTSKDILTFVSFDSTDLYLTSIRNLV